VTYEGFYEGISQAIDHDLYILDQFVYESNYRSGVRVLDAIHVADAQLSEVGFFDLYPLNDLTQYSGTWGNYPYLPSGLVIASSMYDGMFIMKPTVIITSQDNWDLCSTADVIFDVTINADLAFPLTVGIEGLGGATASAAAITQQGTTTITITGINTLSPGEYTPTLLLMSNFGEQYEIPLEVSACPTIEVDETAEAPVEIFPNPTNNLLSIRLKTPVSNIEMLDATGQLVRNIPAQGQRNLEIDVKSMAPGAYTLKAGEYATRVIIAH